MKKKHRGKWAGVLVLYQLSYRGLPRESDSNR